MIKTTFPHWIMCPPDYFSVEYEINPWMQGNIGQSLHQTAVEQWQNLYDILAARRPVKLVRPVSGLPDMPFTANAGLALDNVFVPSVFKFTERQPEAAYFIAWFEQQGYQIKTLPDNVCFEGEGDALFQPDDNLLWVGCGVRTDQSAHASLSNLLHIPVISLQLTNPYFYHLDTCFAPLPGKRALYYPQAFAEASLQQLRYYFPPTARYEVGEEDAVNFSCNAIVCDNTIICNKISSSLSEKLHSWGFEVITTSLSEFMLAGGAAKCLVLTANQPM